MLGSGDSWQSRNREIVVLANSRLGAFESGPGGCEDRGIHDPPPVSCKNHLSWCVWMIVVQADWRVLVVCSECVCECERMMCEWRTIKPLNLSCSRWQYWWSLIWERAPWSRGANRSSEFQFCLNRRLHDWVCSRLETFESGFRLISIKLLSKTTCC